MDKSTVSDRWRIWDKATYEHELFYQRATGVLPEMESSKAAARRMRALIRTGDRVLDVGCGAGHYLLSLRRAISVPFAYVGADATASHLEGARAAWKNADGASFQQADIFSLPFADAEFDIVMCNNLLLHLPSIEIPLRELVRVARRAVLVRTLIGERTFRIMEARDPDTQEIVPGAEQFDEHGEPTCLTFFNIYSEAYVARVLKQMPRVARFAFEADTDYDPAVIAAAAEGRPSPNTTDVMAGLQVNGYILQPWQFVLIEL